MHVPYPTGFIRARMLAQLFLLLCPFAVGFSGIVKSRRSGGCAAGKGAENRSADRAGFGSPARRNDRLLPARREQTPDHFPDDPRTQPSGRGIPDRHQIPAGCNGRIPRRDGSQTGAHTVVDKLYVRYFSPDLRTDKFSVGTDSGLLGAVRCDKVLVEFLRVNGWIRRWFDLDYTEYTHRQSGYLHLPLRCKIEYLSKLPKFGELSVCEDVTEHYHY